jgi:putative protease
VSESRSRSIEVPELLSPAGNWDCARAAVANGANAIYFGMPRFNARLRADNFTEADLPELMRFLHEHGVRGYCTCNTLIFTSELEAIAEQLRVLEAAGVDAVIVQDLGLARMVKALAPGLHLHASTQMTITSPEGLRLASKLGLDLAVLARELSLRDLERFAKARDTGLDIPLEVFVHGALCVAYSGQCLTSESLGQRSANRGECAQACRMPYQLLVDGVHQDLGDKRYLLSPQDLAAVAEIPRLTKLGLRSFKIEGRLKSPEYVAAVTRVYRKAMDTALEDLEKEAPVSAEDRYSLEMTFSRGLYSGWMHGVNHQELVPARSGTKRGAYLGQVAWADGDEVALEEMAVPVKAGDGVVFENPADTDHEQGGYVYAVHGQVLGFQRGRLKGGKIAPGTRVYKTSDPALERTLRATFQGEIPVRKSRKLRLAVSGAAGAPLRLAALDAAGQPLAEVVSGMDLQVARTRPLNREILSQQLGKLGGTPFEIGSLEVRLEGDVIVPVSELNRMRRDLVAALEGQPAVSTRQPARAASVAEMLGPITARRDEAASGSEPRLTVLCRTMEQIEAALERAVERVYVDFEDVRRYGDAVRLAKGRAPIFLATPRIQKSGEEGFFKLIERTGPDGVLIRNLGAIEYFGATGLRMIGDFSLNVANPLTAEFLLAQGLERLTVSYDLNIEQVLDLLRNAPPNWFELTVHQHMPMFHMEHCVFAAFLSEGKSFLDCGRPCERHQVKLRDRVGMEHPLKADAGCRNTLFNASAQTGARFYDQMIGSGLRDFRVELLEESQEESLRVLRLYQGLLAGEKRGEGLWRELKAQSQLGVTLGTLG